MKGFEEENRTYLKTVNFGCITDLEVASYTEQLTYVEPLLLYRWWDDKKSYYDIKYSNYDEFRAITDNDQNFLRYSLMKQFNPIICGHIIREQQQQKRQEDPDSKYLHSVDNSFSIDHIQRHILEQLDPVIYGQYTIEQEYGCEHGRKGAYLYCEECKEAFGCIICHNSNVDDHTIQSMDEIQRVKCCKCGQLQPVNDACKFCNTKFSNCYCQKCRTIRIYDLETEPYWHCDKCDKCHFGFKQEYAKYCEKCKTCIDMYKFESHICTSECVCVICQDKLYPNQDHITLNCNPNHKLHEQCYEQYRKQVYSCYLCPYCKQLILSDAEQMHMKYSSVQKIILKQTYRPVFNLLYCNVCKADQVSYSDQICRKCWMTCEIKAQEYFKPEELQKLLQGYFTIENKFVTENKQLIQEMIRDMFINYEVVYQHVKDLVFGPSSNMAGDKMSFDIDDILQQELADGFELMLEEIEEVEDEDEEEEEI